MLVLSRRVGESIIIGDNIQITIVDMHKGRVRLGIKAPDDVRIDRQEIHDRRAEFAAPPDLVVSAL